MNSKAYRIVNEVFNSVTHGIGFGLAIAGLVLLLVKGAHNDSALEIVSYTIYGSTLILLFLFSTLAHSLAFTKASTVFQVFDHSAIYLLIAGTYTPYCLVALRGWLGWLLFAIVWICAIVGITLKAIYLPKQKQVPKISTSLYIVMGWLVIFAAKPIWEALGSHGALLLLAGGIAYSVGAIIYSVRFPFNHVVWHLFIIAAAILMWFSVYLYI